MVHLLAFLLIVTPLAAPADTVEIDTQEADSFRIYQPDGTEVSLQELAAATDTAQVVFFGEQHNDPVAHALQDSLFRQMHARADTLLERPLTLSLEMFDRDVQYILDEYLQGHISEEHFLQSSRPWRNYQSDYRPMVEFARDHEHAVLAANAPRRYANVVSREGREALADLPEDARRLLPPLPYPEASRAYRDRWTRVMAQGHQESDEALADTLDADTLDADTLDVHHAHDAPEEDTFLDAQVLWDASMAYSIAEHLLREPNAGVLHVTGSFHVDRGLGTPEMMQYYRPRTDMLVIVARPVDGVTAFDERRHGPAGDFIILTDATLPRSF